jgi:Tripartite tricarboxylate transporter TctB family
MRLSLERLTYLVGFGFSLILFWQATGLDTWSVIGPGPGLFPMLTTSFCCIVAGILFLFPRLAQSPTDTARGPDAPLEPAERRTFISCCIALPLLAVASAYLGFFVTSLVLVLLLTWFAERKSWRAALVYGVLCGVVGVIGFGHFLGATLPATEIDNFLMQLVR